MVNTQEVELNTIDVEVDPGMKGDSTSNSYKSLLRWKKPTTRQCWGLFSAILFYADLATDWMVAVKFFLKEGGGSNCWIPTLMVVFLVISSFISVLVINDDKNGAELYSARRNVKCMQFTGDILGFSVARLFSKEWRFNFYAGLCQRLVLTKCCCSTWISLFLTSYVIATESSPALASFEVETYVWVCWGVSLAMMCFTWLPGDLAESNEEHFMFGVLKVFMFLVGITTPFICVFWWPNVGLYGVIFAWCALWCLPGAMYESIEEITFFGVMTFVALSIIQVYFIATKEFSRDALILAGFGTAVAVGVLFVAYVLIGYVAVDMMFDMVREFLGWIRNRRNN